MKNILKILLILVILVQTFSCSSDDDGEYITYEGKKYKIVTIGSQTWMAKDLNYKTESGSECVRNNESDCEAHGRAYDWITAMDLPERCAGWNVSCQELAPHHKDIYRKGVCPEGWHIPTKAEWDVLFNFVGNKETAAKHLKAVEGWDSCGPLSSGDEHNIYSCEDTYGFAALPGGRAFDGAGNAWWSGSEGLFSGLAGPEYRAYSWSAGFGRDNIVWGSTQKKAYAEYADFGWHHVRCIKGGEKCGAEGLMYNASNANLRCRNNHVQTKCGTHWYNPGDTTLRCQGYYVTPTHKEAKCGRYSYHVDNPSYKCIDDVLEVLCETGWLSYADYYMEDQCFAAETSDKEYIIETLCGKDLHRDWYNAADPNLRCESEEVETKCGPHWYNAFNPNLRCQNSALETQCIDGWHDYDNYHMKEACFGSVADADGQTYKTVKIGRQTWMAENLNYRPKDGGSQCSDHLIGTYCASPVGRTYTWEAAMASCPEGWRLPTEEEWEVLDYAAGGDGFAGKHLKAKHGWAMSGYDPSGNSRFIWPNDSNGVDLFGFAALPSFVNDNGIGNMARWWTRYESICLSSYSSELDCASFIAMYGNIDGVSVHNGVYEHKVLPKNTTYISVRCIKE